ncbi:MAG: MarR family transcriptional regulator [Candidatus Thermoplasmatota archaeon]|nr:MarR family transcriptional regulator [Candidatus Thermoplasmatota archaeon]
MPEPPIPTRYAILLELLRSAPLRASDLTEATGLTVQGVSYHLKQMEGDGLVAFEGEDRRARLTPAGVEELHDHFQGLKAFVDYALSQMLPVETCVALAGEDLRAGQEVGLFMEAGRLVARAEASPSTGRVRHEVEADHPVVVEGLSGLVDLEPGDVHLVRLPPPDRLPSPQALGALVADRVPTWEVLVLAGLEAELLAERSGLSQGKETVRFAPAQSARAAAQVGLDVLLIASREHAAEVAAALRREAGETARPNRVVEHELGPEGT